ncbi:MAG: zinc ABC transporter substrate-binding protein [Treponema sp.]|nr:zinc ABC transporter substrate-binding protein [Treponema sp.]
MPKTVLFFLIVLLAACSRNNTGSQPAQNETPLIAVSIPPQAWFVSRIAGGMARTMILAGPGQNPHNYEPGPRQMHDLGEARAWILSGTEFEISLLPKIAALFPALRIVDGTEGVAFRRLEDHDDDDHNDLSSIEIDRHTWLGCTPAKILAAHVRDTLSLIDSANAARYAQRCDELIREIDDEFEMLRIELAPLKGKSVFVYHPSFGYFLDEFGIYQEAVETGGKEPNPRELNRLMERVRQQQAAAIFVQSQYPVNAARTLAASVGAELISLDPLAEDWLANIRLMGAALMKAAASPQPAQ